MMSLLDTDCHAALVLVKVVLHLTAAFSRLTNGAGTFGAWKFAVGDKWHLRHLAFQTIGAWIFCAQDIMPLDFGCLRQLVPGKFLAQDIWHLDFWW